MARAPAPPPPPAARTRVQVKTLLTIIVVIALGVAIIPGILFIAGIGLLPSIVALLMDPTRQKHKTMCVFGMNASGVFPYILEVIFTGNSFDAAKETLTSAFPYLVMLVTAGLGYLLFMIIPPIVATFLTVMAQRKIATLRTTQRHIIEEWGEEVARHGKGLR